jgi:uncharacterized phage protein (TIGR02218 family)
MRTIPPELAAHLDGGITTLCRCWRVTRRDGAVLGFTDHDENLTADATFYAAASGLDAAETASQLGLAVGGGEVAGALSAAGLTERDLAHGLWDSARVEVFLVNWQAPAQHVRLWVGEIGEVKREGAAFSAELRGLMHRLEARMGRLFTRGCDACLGDARCGVDLSAPAYTVSGAVTGVAGALELRVSGLEAFEGGWFAQGVLTWATGGHTNLAVSICEHVKSGPVSILKLWEALPSAAQVGDTFTVTAGCDRQFATCKAKFANAVNFRGFPHMPGNDFVLRVPTQGEPGFDGGSLFV